MTFKDILDTLVEDTSETGSVFRAQAWRWIRLLRQEAAKKGMWKSAKDSEATFDTSASNTTGIYALTGVSSVSGDELYNVTDDSVIRRDTENSLKANDANQNENGPPVLWADAGMNASGEVKIRLWPIPAETFTIVYLANKRLTDVDSSMEMLTVDPYFGDLAEVSGLFDAGLRYYYDRRDNVDTIQTRSSRKLFEEAIRLYSSTSGADSVSTSRLEPVGRRPYARPLGRLDPSHYNNRR